MASKYSSDDNQSASATAIEFLDCALLAGSKAEAGSGLAGAGIVAVMHYGTAKLRRSIIEISSGSPEFF